jgi:preprotein translocase subunit SecF
VDLDNVRATLVRIGLPDATVQTFGTSESVLVRLPARQDVSGSELSEKVFSALKQDDPAAERLRVDFVGSQVGKELVNNGALALMLVSTLIVLYLWLRFEWKFGVAAIIANLHDVVIILGFFAFFQCEFSLPVLAAVWRARLPVNESVVVFDRIRENSARCAKPRSRRDQQRHHPYHVAHHHHPRLHPVDGDVVRCSAATRCSTSPSLCHRDSLRHLLLVLVASPIVMWLGVSREDLVKPEKSKQEAVV